MSHAPAPAPRTRVAPLFILAATLLAGATHAQVPPPSRAPGGAPASPGASSVHGRAVESEIMEPVPGAEVLLLDLGAEVLRRTTTGADGAFHFAGVPAGRYMLQAAAGGRSSALVGPVEPGKSGDTGADGWTVVIPSAVFAVAMACPSLGQGTVLAGIIYDEETGVPLPGARIAIRSAGAAELATATTDARGRYRFCAVAAGAPLEVVIGSLGRSATAMIDVPDADFARADLGLRLGIGSSELRVVATTPLADPAAPPVITGQVIAADGGGPVAEVAVRVAGNGAATVAGEDGRFQLGEVVAGDVLLEVEHLAFGTYREVVRVEPGTRTAVELRLAPRPIALNPVEVAGSAAARTAARGSPSRFALVAGAELAVAEARGALVVDLVRTMPGITVMEGVFTTRRGLTRGYCITSTRRVQSFGGVPGTASAPGCEPIPLIIDGVAVDDPVPFLRLLNVSDYESVQLLGAMEAQLLFGLAGGGAGGALVLWTRGRGPFASDARNNAGR